MNVTVTNLIPEAGVKLLRDAGLQVKMPAQDGCPERGEVLKQIAGADAVVTLLTDRVDDEFLDAAGPQLQIVANVAVGYNNIDVAACAARGVTVTNTPTVLTEATADLAFALILAATRRLGEGERLIRSGQEWQWGMFMMLGSGLQGKNLGIVGAGNIGLAVARRARAFGMNVWCYEPNEIPPEQVEALAITKVGFDELLRESDVISVHCPLTADTRHLIGAAQFEQMKPGAYLVNSARGPIVDEQALVQALESGRIAGAGLDVYENEPVVPESLRRLENVVLLPHLGSATVETRDAMAALAAQNVVNVVVKKTAPVTPVRG